MYTNINTKVCIETISFIIKSEEQFKSLPHDAIINALNIIMHNNYMQFGDTLWKQLLGCAMGTPPAPPFATLYFSLHKDKCVSLFKDNIFFYRRFIDDVFGIGIPSENNNICYKEFQTEMNKWYNLKWEFEDLSSSANFMDLTL